MSPGAKAAPATMVNVHPIGRSREELAPVETGITSCDDGPRVCVGGRFAGEVAGVELRDGGVEVVEVERDPGLDPVVGVDLDYPQEIALNAPDPRRCASIGNA